MNLEESGAHHDDAVHAAGLDEQRERVEDLRARPRGGEVFLDESSVFPARYCRLASEYYAKRGRRSTGPGDAPCLVGDQGCGKDVRGERKKSRSERVCVPRDEEDEDRASAGGRIERRGRVHPSEAESCPGEGGRGEVRTH